MAMISFVLNTWSRLILEKISTDTLLLSVSHATSLSLSVTHANSFQNVNSLSLSLSLSHTTIVTFLPSLQEVSSLSSSSIRSGNQTHPNTGQIQNEVSALFFFSLFLLCFSFSFLHFLKVSRQPNRVFLLYFSRSEATLFYLTQTVTNTH